MVLITEFQLAKYYMWSNWTKHQPKMASHRKHVVETILSVKNVL